jgi:transcriptional regulator of acetoin/glycerol metabolism
MIHPLVIPTTRLERRRATDLAWRRFIVDGLEPNGVGSEIARSWQRARAELGIDPEMKHLTRLLSPDALRRRCEEDDVLHLALPILSDFAGRLGLEDHVLTYFDSEGWLLSIVGEPGVVEAVSVIDFRPGANWAEASAGTNGPGTALAEGRAVEVFASEHFVAAWQPWSCAAAPVMAPGSAAPVGVVDVTGPWESRRRHGLVTAQAIARAIQERLRAACSVRDEVIRYAFRAAHASGDALVAVDGRGAVVAANDAAARRGVIQAGALPPRHREALLRTLRTPIGTLSASDVRLDLPDSPGLVVSAVAHDGTVVGAIIRAPAARSGARSHAGRRQDVATGTADSASTRYDFSRIKGASAALALALDLARVAARNTLGVTLLGESGTGKELFAHAIHAASERRDGPFVAMNCGSIPAELLVAELFGYEAGAFTGGRRDGNAGRFEDADGGTIFLDEVTDLSGPAQVALLRVLQEKEIVRLGASAPRRLDVRIIAATNRPFPEEIKARRFRRDLYYRLNVLSIEIPPLRDRAEDVVELAQAFLSEAEAEVGREGLALTDEALEALRAHRWPGNVRELRNVVLRAAATARSPRIGPADLLLQDEGPGHHVEAGRTGRLAAATNGTEREALLEVLGACGWNFSRAAARLGISRMTLYRRVAQHEIVRGGPSPT